MNPNSIPQNSTTKTNNENKKVEIPNDFLKKVQFMEKYPQILKNYIKESFKQCTSDSEREIVSEKLLEKIESSQNLGILNTFDWSQEPIVEIHEKESKYDNFPSDSNRYFPNKKKKWGKKMRDNENQFDFSHHYSNNEFDQDNSDQYAHFDRRHRTDQFNDKNNFNGANMINNSNNYNYNNSNYNYNNSNYNYNNSNYKHNNSNYNYNNSNYNYNNSNYNNPNFNYRNPNINYNSPNNDYNNFSNYYNNNNYSNPNNDYNKPNYKYNNFNNNYNVSNPNDPNYSYNNSYQCSQNTNFQSSQPNIPSIPSPSNLPNYHSPVPTLSNQESNFYTERAKSIINNPQSSAVFFNNPSLLDNYLSQNYIDPISYKQLCRYFNYSSSDSSQVIQSETEKKNTFSNNSQSDFDPQVPTHNEPFQTFSKKKFTPVDIENESLIFKPKEKNNFGSHFYNEQNIKHNDITKEDISIDDEQPVIGTCQNLEKPYLRLTSAPEPNKIRPLEVLEKAFTFVLQKFEEKKDYSYIEEQLRSIRQDLVVQHIENEFLVNVYEKHVQLAIENKDWMNLNQCQTKLEPLYAKGLGKLENKIKVAGYRILYMIGENDSDGLFQYIPKLSHEIFCSEEVQFALLVWKNIASNNYAQFFELVKQSNPMQKNLLSIASENVRAIFLNNIVNSFKKIRISDYKELLGFDSIDETIKFLSQTDAPIVSE